MWRTDEGLEGNVLCVFQKYTFSSSPKRPSRFWVPHDLLINAQLCSFLGVKLKGNQISLHPVPILRLCGDSTPIPLKPLWCGQGWVYLLTYSMVQSSSWEATCFVASQEVPSISRNPKVHYRTHKRPQPVSILGQPNPVHIPTSHLLEIRRNIIHPSTLRSPHWSPSFRFPHQDPIHPTLLTHTRHMPSTSHSSRFYHPHNIGRGIQLLNST